MELSPFRLTLWSVVSQYGGLPAITAENRVDLVPGRGLDWVIARPFNHIGPGQGPGFLLPDLAAALAKGEEPKNLTVDSEWNTGDMRALALSMRGIAANHVTFMMALVAGTSTDPTYGSIVNINEAQSKELFTALKDDSIEDYLTKYPDEALKPPDEVH